MRLPKQGNSSPTCTVPESDFRIVCPGGTHSICCSNCVLTSTRKKGALSLNQAETVVTHLSHQQEAEAHHVGQGEGPSYLPPGSCLLSSSSSTNSSDCQCIATS